jgi:hypothetical protein
MTFDIVALRRVQPELPSHGWHVTHAQQCDPESARAYASTIHPSRSAEMSQASTWVNFSSVNRR